jgi:tetratricopeptide (TPR) repeat protein
LLHKGLLEADEGNYREAIPLFEQIVKADPKMALANLQLGRAWNSLGDYDKAVPWLQKAVELTPESAEAHYELGAALGEMVTTWDLQSRWKPRLLKILVRTRCTSTWVPPTRKSTGLPTP